MIQKNVSVKATVCGTTITVKAPETFLLSTRENNIEPEHIDEEVDEEDEEIHENDNAYVVIFNTDKPVNRITQLGSLPDSLGWTNSFLVDEHYDGTRTVYFDVRFHEIDNSTGKIISSVDITKYTFE